MVVRGAKTFVLTGGADRNGNEIRTAHHQTDPTPGGDFDHTLRGSGIEGGQSASDSTFPD